MRVICDGLSLGNAVLKVSKAMSNKSVSTILEGIKLTAKDSYLILMATDNEITIEQKVIADVLVEGECVVLGKYFSDFIKKLSNEQIELQLNRENILKIKYRESEGALSCLNIMEFPAFERVECGESFSVYQKDLKDLINKTIPFVSTEDSRPILKGVLIEVEDNSINGISLDGYRLALVKKPIVVSTREQKIIVPAKSLSEIAKLLDDDESPVTIQVENNKLLVHIGETTLQTRLIEGEFIKYKSILPAAFTTKVSLNKEELTDSIERASVMSRGIKNNIITLDFSEKLMSVSTHSEIGSINEKHTVKCKGNGITVNFNPKYIYEALRVIEDEFVGMYFNTPTTPSVIVPIEGDAYVFMVLPVRYLNN